MVDIGTAFLRLAAGSFRRKFAPRGRELDRIQTWGMASGLHSRDKEPGYVVPVIERWLEQSLA